MHCDEQMMNDGSDQKQNGNFLSVDAGAVGLCITGEELAWVKGGGNLKGENLLVFFISHIYITMQNHFVFLSVKMN